MTSQHTKITFIHTALGFERFIYSPKYRDYHHQVYGPYGLVSLGDVRRLPKAARA